MNRSKLSRRTFLKTTAAAAVGATLAPRNWAQVPGANGDLRIGLVGVGAQGRAHVKGYMEGKGVRIVALCDVDSANLERSVKTLRDAGQSVDTFVDLRKMLERSDIDAISIATPNHQHSLQSIWGFQAGKHVYVEKPLCHNIWEGRQLVAASQKHNLIGQHGTGSRSSRAIAEAVAWVRAGNLGKITAVRGLCYKRRESIGKTTGPQEVPKTVNYDLWLGPAPMTPLRRKNLHYDFHWQWATGNGDLGNQGCHQMDIARWFLGDPGVAPETMTVGGRFGYEDDGETPNTLVLVHNYKPAPLIFEVRGLPAKSGAEAMDAYEGAAVGVVVHCEGGIVAMGRGGPKAFDRAGKEVKQFTAGAGQRDSHYQNFVDVVRSGKRSELRCPVSEGFVSAVLSHTGNISYRVGKMVPAGQVKEQLRGDAALAEAYGRMVEHLAANGVSLDQKKPVVGVPLRFDGKTERFIGNDAANAFLTREYRSPFVVPQMV
ncbi:MAG TPA: Gfo/Idh/MocA family oxidoreductase [Opitutaceae bacterium]|nr:Gfo/Idh/MocA family oxidoreductase [Opitutaceae bacterium]